MKKVYADANLEVSKGDFEMPTGCTNKLGGIPAGPLGGDDYEGLFGEGDSETDNDQSIPAGLPRETDEFIPSDSTNFDQ
jgi:hypothetical protein